MLLNNSNNNQSTAQSISSIVVVLRQLKATNNCADTGSEFSTMQQTKLTD